MNTLHIPFVLISCIINLNSADLLNAIIVNPKDDEEMALTLNGKKKKLKKEDFIKLAESIGIEKIIVGRLINKYIKLLPKFKDLIFNSFLSEELQKDYFELLNERLDRLRLK